MATITDGKLWNDSLSDYLAEVVSATDYEPFGLALEGRSLSNEGYRYGFNGKEDDGDFSFGIQDYGFRLYSRKLAKFLSVDPLFQSFPWNSVYAFAEGDVIQSIDLDGLERIHYTLLQEKTVDGGPVLQLWKAEEAREVTVASILSIFGSWADITVRFPFAKEIIVWQTNEYGIRTTGYRFKNMNEAFSAVKNNFEGFDPSNRDATVNAEQMYLNNVNKSSELLGTVGAALSNVNVVSAEQRRLIKVKYRGKQPTGDRYGKIESKVDNGFIYTKDSKGNWELANPTTQKGKPKHVDFVITRDGKLVIGDGHYNLSDEATFVQGAGRIKIENGKIVNVTNNTGHYRPTESELQDQAKILREMGVASPTMKISPIKKVQ